MSPEFPAHQRLLLTVLAEPATAMTCNTAEWELLLRMAQKAKLLGDMAIRFERAGVLTALPVRVQQLLQSNLIEVRSLQQQMRWELNRIDWALANDTLPIIVLKGAAYELAGLPMADGRYSADLDILVAKENLGSFERLLQNRGWLHPQLSAYDEHYYRAWSHEIPALVHRERRTEVDVHHALAPVTSTVQVNTGLLFASSIPTRLPRYRILCPVDMVLHCAVNLFQNNDLADDLRDLLDLDTMLRNFSSTEPDFWRALITRANQLRLGKVLFYGLQFARRICAAPIPDNLEGSLQDKPGRLSRWLMRRLVPLVLLPLHPDHPAPLPRIARFVLYVRSHWIRMPLHVLLVHVTYKSYARVLAWFEPGPAWR